MPAFSLSIAAQLLAQIHTLGAIGADESDGGRTRVAASDEDKLGRDQLVQWIVTSSWKFMSTAWQHLRHPARHPTKVTGNR